MERLTKEVGGHLVFPNELVGVALTPDNETMYALLTRLAAYEDTGLMPDEIKALKASFETLRDDASPLVQAQIEGRLVVLPSKTVFELRYHPGSRCNTICPVTIDGIGQCHFCDYGELQIHEIDCKQEHLDQIGESIFLSRTEAEAALAEQKE